MITDQLQNLFESTFIAGHSCHMPPPDILQELLDKHPKAALLKADDRLVNAMACLQADNDKNYSDFSRRLDYRAPLRRALTVLRENGVDIRVDISFTRTR